MILMISSKKMFGWRGAKWTILGSKMTHSHNSGSAVRIFFLNLHNENGQ